MDSHLPGLREDPKLVAADGRFRLAQASPAVDAAKGEFDFVTSDVENQARPNDSKDIGADEYVSKKPAQPTVLSREQVGTTFLDRRSPHPSKSRKS